MTTTTVIERTSAAVEMAAHNNNKGKKIGGGGFTAALHLKNPTTAKNHRYVDNGSQKKEAAGGAAASKLNRSEKNRLRKLEDAAKLQSQMAGTVREALGSPAAGGTSSTAAGATSKRNLNRQHVNPDAITDFMRPMSGSTAGQSNIVDIPAATAAMDSPSALSKSQKERKKKRKKKMKTKNPDEKIVAGSGADESAVGSSISSDWIGLARRYADFAACHEAAVRWHSRPMESKEGSHMEEEETTAVRESKKQRYKKKKKKVVVVVVEPSAMAAD